MMKYIKSIWIILLACVATIGIAQQNIGIGTTAPDSSAILDITSTDMGVLIPRMSATARQNINSPALGLMVFDSTNNAFYYFNGIGWLEMLAGSVKVLADTDNDTGIRVEESTDDDVIRFDVQGMEVAAFDGQTFHMESPGNSLMIGRDAGISDDGGENKNVFIGPLSGSNNTHGADNTALGYSSFNFNVDGDKNTAIGNNALSLNLTGSNNTAVGENAMPDNTVGDDNVAVGSDGLVRNSSGSKNVGVGTAALDDNINGNFNTAIGYHANVGGHSLNHATAIGANAVVAQDSSIVLGSAAKVGIGTSAPDSKLHVIGNIQMQDGNEQEGYLLIADSTGRMQWTDPAAVIPPGSLLNDLDSDTKIQVEESPDEDIIRFDLGGTEYFKMSAGHLEPVNTNGSVYFGEGAGQSVNLSKSGNVAIGQNALQQSGGNLNVAIGKEAMQLSNSSDAVGIGFRALLNNIGDNNTAVGTQALELNTQGSQNSAFGDMALNFNTTGYYNTALGYNSLKHNVTGNENVAVGRDAGGDAQTGNGNVLIGYSSGQFIDSGNENVALGNYALGASDHDRNVALGYEAGIFANGDSSVFLGYQAGYNSSGSNKLYIANSEVGSTGALIYGEFDSQLLRINGNLNINGAYQFPTTDGSDGQVLKTNSAGVLSWQDDQGSASDTARILADIDGDTKIQVEESADEDLIRFDISGTEYFRMGMGRLEVLNSGQSVFIGQNAGENDDLTNNENVFIGYEAGRNNTTGRYNTAVGKQALLSPETGTHNTALGAYALTAADAAKFNTAIGVSALGQHVTGDRNTSIGAYSLGILTAGNSNVAIGFSALDGVATEVVENVAVGTYAGQSSHGSGNVFLGYQVGRNLNQNNRLMIDNHETLTPLIFGEFDNDWLMINGRLTPRDGITDADGDTKIQVEESADENVLRFDVAGTEVFTLTDTVSTLKGTGRDLLLIKTLNNTVETGLAFQNTGSSYTWSIHRSASNTPDLVFSGGNTPANVDDLIERLRITKDGNVGIATDTFDYKFQVGNAGDGTEARANAWNTFSDRRWKTDFAVITNPIEKIEAINGYYYKWKNRPDTTTQVGVIAQEIEAVLPEVVSTDARGYKSVDYSKLTALLIQGMKEQHEMIQEGRQLNITQQEVISQLKANQTNMQARLDSIESQVASTAQN